MVSIRFACCRKGGVSLAFLAGFDENVKAASVIIYLKNKLNLTMLEFGYDMIGTLSKVMLWFYYCNDRSIYPSNFKMRVLNSAHLEVTWVYRERQC